MIDLKSALAGGGAVLVAGASALSFLLGGAAGDVADPIDDAPTVKVIASSGIEGYRVDLFCNDPLTKLKPQMPAPEAPRVFELTRTRDNVTETVVYVEGAGSAVHYYDTAIGQQSEPAVVNEAALDCIVDKSK